MSTKLKTVDDIYDALMEVEKFVYHKRQRNEIDEETNLVIHSLLGMCKNIVVGFGSSDYQNNLGILENGIKKTPV